MAWTINFTEKAGKDYDDMDNSQQQQIVSALRRVSKNPLPQREGGYDVELGNKNGLDLTGCLKIKLKKAGIRIVYTLERTEQGMVVVVIGMRDNDKVYEEAARRLGRLKIK